MLSTIRKYSHLIESYTILRLERAGPSFRFQAHLILNDKSHLYIRETLIEGLKRKYAYHWQDKHTNLLIRWDNAPDWEVETFPHHKHINHQNNVHASYERTLARY